ncbi:MAG: hypothetical protein KatS3mg131_1115 [Candidatus Tectimicrobiota bacterium]|nr:MAG: hypothetical protein KatS3mg131_1115 [Candidatus Tectomicrobia bacterium]
MTQDAIQDVDAIEFYFDKGVTDGLPVVPPTEERVQRMLAATSRAPDEVIALVPPNYGEATVEKIAVNAVMAGCKPAYLPVVLAGVQAMCDERVNLHGVQGTTHTATPLFIVNGPIRRELDINCGAGVFGSGWRANATIGRALRLIMVNIGGARPGEIDKSTMGHPGKYTYLIGEYEEVSPWEPLHVEQGFAREQSTISVYCCDAPQCISNHGSRTARGILQTIGASMAVGWSDKTYLADSYLVVIGPEHAKTIAADGLSKQDVKRFLYETVRRPLRELLPGPDGSEGLARERLPGWLDATRDETLVPKVASPEGIIVVVAGGTAGRFSLHMCGWGSGAGASRLVTVPISKE